MFIVILGVNHPISKRIEEQIAHRFYGCRKKEDNIVLRVEDHKSHSKDSTLSRFNASREILHMANVVFDTVSQTFLKHRYGSVNDISDIDNLPSSMRKFMVPVKDILLGNDIDYLKSKYSVMNLMEAIYLTGTYKKFINVIDMVNYHLIKYKYGRGDEIPPYFIRKIYEQCPEHLI